MAGTGFAPYVTESEALDFFALANLRDSSPLRMVTTHVAARAIGGAVALVGQPTVAGLNVVAEAAEQWVVEKYVGDHFCGLCGRDTNHQGEH